MYSQKAFDILNASINSAVFIDEKAKDFFSGTPINNEIVEEQLSKDLFDTFKANGKSLIVHKFDKNIEYDSSLINYLFSGKDLILLDWELDEEDGQQYSLELLLKSIETPNINFCCIYSRSTNFDKIPLYLTAYFSGLLEEEIEIIKNTYDYLTSEEINDFQNNPDNDIEVFFSDNKISLEEFPIVKFRNKPKKIIVDLINIALNNKIYFFQKEPQINHEVIFSGEDSFIINNTFVLTVSKEKGDIDYEHLIHRVANEVIKNKSSFFQLLGLEMQSVFNSNERFIDETILKSSTEALFQFRNHIKDDKIFGIIVKKLLIEQATLKLRTAKLKLLETNFLDIKSGELASKIPSNEDLFQLNVFYNSVSVKSLHPDDIPNLNFGDVFIGSEEDYYLCITALCDCYYPNKIDHNFYFVKGTEFTDMELALSLGDTAFLSFLPNGKAIYWGDIEKPKLKKIANIILSDSKDDPDKLNGDISTLKGQIQKFSLNQNILNSFLYKPFYIKPKVYNVQNNKLIDNKIRIWDITNKFTKEEFDQNLNYFNVEYLTTLRNDYTQRIANHAFGHPARVGVDFVKK